MSGGNSGGAASRDGDWDKLTPAARIVAGGLSILPERSAARRNEAPIGCRAQYHPCMFLVTGANGELGLRLLRSLANREVAARAAVRSEKALKRVETTLGQLVDTRIVDYRDPDSLARAMEGCSAVIHLVGTIRGTKRHPYERSHEDVVDALIRAALQTGSPRIVQASIFGADPDSTNGCLASRGRCDHTLLASAPQSVVLRAPMVLSPGGPAARALYARASGRSLWLGSGEALEQPLDARDFVDAAISATACESTGGFDLVGPECLSYRELVQRAASLLATRPQPLRVPSALALGLAGLASRLLPDPPVTRDMLALFLHDDCGDPEPAVKALGIKLRDLNDTLRFSLGRLASEA